MQEFPLYVWTSPLCLDAPLYVLMIFWMPPVHTQHKESMLCQTKGVSICPHTFGYPHMFGCPLYVQMAPICLDTPTYVWMPLYLWISPICLDTPICLDAPHVCLDDVWMPGVHIQHKESMLCQTKGVSICPHTFECPLYIWMSLVYFNAPICLGHHPYFWIPPLCFNVPYMFGHSHMFGCPPVCLNAPICLDAHLYVWMSPYVPPYMFGCPCMFGHPLYVWMLPCMF